jgi:hypothetical protein
MSQPAQPALDKNCMLTRRLYTIIKALNWRNEHKEEAAAPGP